MSYFASIRNLSRRLFEGGGQVVREYVRDTKGATAILFSFGTVVLTGSIAFGVDAANWYQTDRRLQTGSDVAAMAAASEKMLQSTFGYNGGTLSDIVYAELERSGVDVARLASVTVNSPPASGSFAGDPNAVEVITAEAVQIFFAGFFLETTPQASARAVARTFMSGNYCILTLHPTQSGAVSFAGSASAFLGCGIASNSTASDSIYATGSSVIETTIATAVGGISDGGNIVSPLNLQPYSNPVEDPYDDLVVPPAAPCDSGGATVTPQSTTTLSPGVYCGDLNFKGSVTLLPGTYVMDGSNLNISATADVYGDDVTFIFTNSSDPATPGYPAFAGGATIGLSASTSGDYAGILFMQDPAAANTVVSGTNTWIINGNSSSSFEGVIYAPQTGITLAGTASFNNGCIQVVSGSVDITGTFNVTQECNDPNLRDIDSISVSLVE